MFQTNGKIRETFAFCEHKLSRIIKVSFKKIQGLKGKLKTLFFCLLKLEIET